MDETGAVGIARGKLERRRHEAYRTRAAATVQIQRWYRRCLVAKGGVRSRGRYARLNEDISDHPSSEGSCTDSTSATNSIVSEQENQGTLRCGNVTKDVGSLSDATPSPVRHRNVWSSAAYQQLDKRSSSFDEFVNSEIAVAKAMLDESYMDKLNDEQRRRVERLMAYKRVSELPNETAEEAQQNSLTKDSPKPIPSQGSRSQAVELNVGSKTIAEQSMGEAKSLIPVLVRTNKKPLQDVQKMDVQKIDKKRENATVRSVCSTHNLHTPDLVKEQVRVEQDVNVHVNKESKQRLSNPLSSSHTEQLNKKDVCAVKKQWHAKDCEQIDQPVSVSLKDTSKVTQLPPTPKVMVKEGNKRQMESDNELKLNKHVKTVDTVSYEQTHLTDSETVLSNKKCDVLREAQAKIETKLTQMSDSSAHVQREEKLKACRKTELKLQQRSPERKVLKFASKVLCVDASSNVVLDPVQQPSTTKPHLTVKLPMAIKQHLQKTAIQQRQNKDLKKQQQRDTEKQKHQDIHLKKQLQHRKDTEKQKQEDTDKQKQQETEKERHRDNQKQQRRDTELAPLKRSSATTKLVLHREIRDEIQALTDSTSSLCQGQNHHQKRLEKRSTMTQTQWMINTAIQTDNGSDGNSNSLEHSAPGYAGVRPRPIGMAELNRHATQGGYSLAYAKRKETNKKKVIKEKKQPTGYLQKFLRSSEVQSLIDDLQNSEKIPDTSWHTAWSSIPGGLPDWGNLNRDSYSPPPRDWEVVMSSVTRRCSESSLGGSYRLPLHQQVVQRRPHHLRPLVAPTGHNKADDRKSYSYHSRHQAQAQYLSHSQQLSKHRRSFSHMTPRSLKLRRGLHYEPDLTI